MNTVSTIRRLALGALAMVAPRYCVVCGTMTGAQDEYPLCGACASSMRTERALAASRGRCSTCGKPLLSEKGRCTRCRTTAYAFDSAFPLYRYSGDARTLVLAYKAAGRRSLALFLAGLIAEAVGARYPGRTIVPVPPRSGKMRKKGWDQVDDIARALERRYGFTVGRVLKRSGGVEQKSLNLEGRAMNMKGRIRLRRNAFVPVDPVLLDDIITTGATLSECAAVLKAAGALRVDAVAIAAD